MGKKKKGRPNLSHLTPKGREKAALRRTQGVGDVALRERITVLEEALEPFASLRIHPHGVGQSYWIYGGNVDELNESNRPDFKWADMLRARKALGID